MPIRPDETSYRRFFTLTSAPRLLEVVLVAVEAGLFETVGEEGVNLESILAATGWEASAGARMLAALVGEGLLQSDDERYYLAPFSRRFLRAASPERQLASLRFERLLQQRWGGLAEVLKRGRCEVESLANEALAERRALFLAAMDEAARLRAPELFAHLPLPARGTLLEAGAGSGAYLATFLETHPDWCGIFLDQPAVVAAARHAPRLMALGARIEYREANLLEMSPVELEPSIDCLLLSNLIHCQGGAESRRLLAALTPALATTGLLVIHDFLAGETAEAPLYDLHMLLNTYNGRTYGVAELEAMVEPLGLGASACLDLPSGSSLFVATRDASDLPRLDPLGPLLAEARRLGFRDAWPISAEAFSVGEWVRAKCTFGCEKAGRSPTCPPASLTPAEMETLLGEYRRAILVVGTPPLGAFQAQLLKLERFALAAGYPKALAFGSGPCSLCASCSVLVGGACPRRADHRPSLEACGVDVHRLMENAGIGLRPIGPENQYVQYVAALLVE